MFWGKLFAFILAVVSLAIAFFMVSLFFNFVSVLNVQQWFLSFYLFFVQNIFFKILGFLVAALFVFLAGALLRFLLPKEENCIIYSTPEGEIKVSFNSLKALTKDALQNMTEIIQADPEIIKIGNDARILLRLLVRSDASVPDLSAAVQNKVRERIEKQTGIVLKDIKLFVDLKPEEKPVENP
ncbi:MAG: alkaline shock response membrane anchor protein AmaP [Atribacterota bacterium]